MSQASRSIPGILTGTVIAFVVSTYALSFVVAFLGLIASQLGPDLLSLNGFLPLELFLLIIPGVVPANALELVATSMFIFGLCFWAAAKDRGGFLNSLVALTKKAKPAVAPNWLVVMPLISSFLLVLTIILSISLNAAGAPIGNISPTSRADLFTTVAFSPVAEEIGFRISTIGLVVAIRTLLPLLSGRRLAGVGVITVAKRSLFALISPDRAKEAAGLPSIGTRGWRGIHWTEWTILLISSIWFGVLHSLSGIGWGPGKALTAALTGLAFGIVYLWYGAYANILLHWFFDFYNITIFGALLGGPYSDIIASLAVFSSLFLGVAGFVYGIRWLAPQKPVITQPALTQMPPPQF